MSSYSLFDLISYQVRFVSSDPERLLNEILRRNIAVWRIRREEEGVSFRILPFRKRAFRFFRKSISSEERWEESPCGLLRIIHLFRKRLGFWLGLLFLALSLFFSTKILWGVDVVGNDQISTWQIRKELSEYGLVPGKSLERLQVKEIALRYDVDHTEYSYVGINLVGTRAKVEVREMGEQEKKHPGYEGAVNLVARTYGRVVRFEVYSGTIQVKRGDYVTENMLLISGVRETKNGSFYPVRASGRVFAQTKRDFSVTVPLEETAVSYDEKEYVQKSYEILGISIPAFPFFKTEKKGDKVLEFAEPVSLFGYDLPVTVRRVHFLNCSEKKAVIKVDRAEKLAYDKYEQFIRGTFGESDEILSENVAISVDESGVTLTAEIEAVENICREAPFRFTLDPTRN